MLAALHHEAPDINGVHVDGAVEACAYRVGQGHRGEGTGRGVDANDIEGRQCRR